MCYNNIKNIKIKTIFIIILIFVFSLPSTFNCFPNYWVDAYPLMYYFIGCYLKDVNKNFKLKKLYLFLTLFIVTTIQMIIQYTTPLFTAYDIINNHSSLFCVLSTCSMFLLLLNIDFKNKFFCKLFSFISPLSLITFLISYVFDATIYGLIITGTYLDNIFSILGCSLLVFILSVISAFIIQKFCLIMEKLFKVLINKIKKTNRQNNDET